MQTTLLGSAIALILALVAALVGPSVVDTNRFRPAIEAEATRLIGAPVRITGPIEITILPSPVLVLHGLEVGPAHAVSSIRMRSLGVELNLGSLVRGEWKAQELHLVGPDFTLGIDGAGNLALPPIAPGFDPDRLSIDKLNIEDGRAVLADSRSASRITLDKLRFNGDVRSLAGPFKGDGAFVIAGDLYAYRVAAGRAEEGALRLRLNIDPVEKPIAVHAEGTLSFPGNTPRFDGAMTLSRPAGIATPSGQTFATDPWKLTSKLKASAASALFEAIEFQYGPEERAVRLAGTAELKFGDRPRFDGILAATQIDLDRAFPSGTGRQLPFASLKALGESFSGAVRPAIPARIGVSVESLTLAGAAVQTVRGDVRSDGEAWNLEGFEMRVPGFTQVNLSGRLDLAPGRFGFTGPVSVDSTDPTALVAWLEGNSTPPGPRMKPFRARGDITLASDRIAFDRLTAEIDRKWVEGRFAYSWAAADKPARLDADLKAAELDIDALLAFTDAARGATTFETPREVTLGLGIGKAVVAGVEASNISARFRRDDTGLHVERLSVGNAGGNGFDISGRIDTTASPPQGALTVRLDARNVAGIVPLAEKFLPGSADLVRRLSQRMPSAQLDATLALDANGAARLALDGRSGDMRVILRGETARGAAAIADLQNLPATEVKLDAIIESDKGPAIIGLLNLGGLIAADSNKPGQLNLAASGPLNNLQLDSRLVAGGLDAAVKGTVQLKPDAPNAHLRLTVTGADARPLRPKSAKPAEPLPVNLAGNLAWTGSTLRLDDFSGSFAGVPARGKLALDFTAGTKIDGQIETDGFDAQAVLAALSGMAPAPDARTWSAAPFASGVLDGAEGRIELRSVRAILSPGLTLLKARGIVKFGRTEVGFTDIEGILADGQAKGQVVLSHRDSGIAANARLRLVNADAATLLASDNKPAITGRVTLQIDVEGAGLSPQTLMGSLSGDGLVSLSRAQFASLNAKVFDTATRAVDQGVALDIKKIGEIASGALEGGSLSVPFAEGVITIAHGQIRLTNLVTRAEGANLQVTGSVDLMEQSLSARLSLTASKDEWRGASEQPTVSIFLSGPIKGPRRAVDVSALTAWLTLRAVELQSKQLEAIEKRRVSVTPPAEPRPAPPVLQITPSAAAPVILPPTARSSPPAPALAAPPAAQLQAPALPPAIDIAPLPNIMDPRPSRPPARAQSAPAAQPRPIPGAPMQLLPRGPDN